MPQSRLCLFVRAAGGNLREQLLPFCREPRGDVFAVASGDFLFFLFQPRVQPGEDVGGGAFAADFQQGIGGLVHLAQGAEVVSGKEFPETEFLRRDGREVVPYADDGLDTFRGQVGLLQEAPDHAVVAAAGE